MRILYVIVQVPGTMRIVEIIKIIKDSGVKIVSLSDLRKSKDGDCWGVQVSSNNGVGPGGR